MAGEPVKFLELRYTMIQFSIVWIIQRFFLLPKDVASHVGFTLAQWNDGKVDEPLSRATFTSENKPLSVNCEVRKTCCDVLSSFQKNALWFFL